MDLRDMVDQMHLCTERNEVGKPLRGSVGFATIGPHDWTEKECDGVPPVLIIASKSIEINTTQDEVLVLELVLYNSKDGVVEMPLEANFPKVLKGGKKYIIPGAKA